MLASLTSPGDPPYLYKLTSIAYSLRSLSWVSPQGGYVLTTKQKAKMTTKKPTAAWNKANDKRQLMNAQRMDLISLTAPDFSTSAFLYEDTKSRPCAIAYKGRSLKSSFHKRFNDINERLNFVHGWMDDNKAQKAKERISCVGDVLVSSWGWEQTNIDYYKIVRLVGKRSVEVVQIGSMCEDTGNMTGESIPDIHTDVGNRFIKQVTDSTGDSIKLNSFSWARPLEFIETNGIKIYRSHSYSYYA